MLVLSRKIGEAILIGDDVVISVEKVQGSRVLIGIKAPRDKVLLRQELMLPPAPPAAPDVESGDAA